MAQPHLTTPPDLSATSEPKWRGKSRLPPPRPLGPHGGEIPRAAGSFTKKWGSPSPTRRRSCGSPGITSLKAKSSLAGIGVLLLNRRMGGLKSQEKLCIWASGKGVGWGGGECHHNRLQPRSRGISASRTKGPGGGVEVLVLRARDPFLPSRLPWTGRMVMRWRWEPGASSCSDRRPPQRGAFRAVCSPHGSGSQLHPLDPGGWGLTETTASQALAHP